MASTLLCANVWAANATASIKATDGSSSLSGLIKFEEKPGGLQVQAEVENAPAGKHGFHIHEKGDCSDMGKAAGGHFNPHTMQHGFTPKDGLQHAHVGDMGNIEVGSDGKGKLSVVLPGVHLTGQDPSVAGLAVILHEKPDDFSQPTGNAGGRIGCGVISLEDESTVTAANNAASSDKGMHD
ncbi:MAG: superoxide dismutase family protein [Candidatus Omnitrophica bacterium]|nr:superoxide dismutase family protein [Candidatus Omnitrophota bacterium]